MHNKKNTIVSVFSLFLLFTAIAVYAQNIASKNTPASVSIIATDYRIGLSDEKGNAITSLDFGAVGRGEKATRKIVISNVGETPFYILNQSLTTDLSPAIGTLTWNFLASQNYPSGSAYAIKGAYTSPIDVTLAVNHDALNGNFTFTVTIAVFNSADG